MRSSVWFSNCTYTCFILVCLFLSKNGLRLVKSNGFPGNELCQNEAVTAARGSQALSSPFFPPPLHLSPFPFLLPSAHFFPGLFSCSTLMFDLTYLLAWGRSQFPFCPCHISSVSLHHILLEVGVPYWNECRQISEPAGVCPGWSRKHESTDTCTLANGHTLNPPALSPCSKGIIPKLGDPQLSVQPWLYLTIVWRGYKYLPSEKSYFCPHGQS